MTKIGSPPTMPRRNLPPTVRRRRVLRVVYSQDASAVGRELELDDKELELGRAVEGPGLFADGRMSRAHARVYRAAGAPRDLVEDLGTRNGSFLDGSPLTKPEPLEPGSVLSIGETLLVVEHDPDPDRLPATAAADDGLAHEIVGSSLFARRLRRSVATVARSPGTVLLLGQTGVGKEVAASAIHRLSGRSGPFIPINCAALPSETAELELFGSASGAFTDAKDRDGFFVQAHGGTLFLDEIGDLPTPLQAKILRVLEDGMVQPLGAGPRKKVDVRVVCATHVDLSGSSFRKDLLARLGDWTLRLPTLAERRGDVLALWAHAIGTERHLSPALAEALVLHDWPANVRELLKLARRLDALAEPGAPLDLDELPEAMQAPLRRRARATAGGGRALDPDATLDPVEGALEAPRDLPRERFEELLREHKGNISMVARATGLWREQLYRLAKRYGLKPEDYRG